MPTFRVIQKFPLANIRFKAENMKEAVEHADKHYAGYLKVECVEHLEMTPNLVRMSKLGDEKKRLKDENT